MEGGIQIRKKVKTKEKNIQTELKCYYKFGGNDKLDCPDYHPFACESEIYECPKIIRLVEELSKDIL